MNSGVPHELIELLQSFLKTRIPNQWIDENVHERFRRYPRTTKLATEIITRPYLAFLSGRRGDFILECVSMANYEGDAAAHQPASFLSKVRFGPGIIGILVSIGCVAFLLYLTGHAYLAATTAGAGLLLVGVKAMEIIHLVSPEKKELVGRRCLVVKRIQKGNAGVVRVYADNGTLDPELWSAESGQEIGEGQNGVVIGIRSIILLVKPTQEHEGSR
jgi:membrane protein implicated in regulation of membrane protease activity